MSDCWLTPNEQIFSYIMARTSYFGWDYDDVRFVLVQQGELGLYSSSSPQQQSTGGYAVSLEDIILIPNQPVFALTP